MSRLGIDQLSLASALVETHSGPGGFTEDIAETSGARPWQRCHLLILCRQDSTAEMIRGWEGYQLEKYVVRLSEEERGRLEDIVSKGKHAAHLATRARILLKADVSEAGEGWSDSRIAEALDTGSATVERTRKLLVEEGFEAVLTRKYNPNSARPRIFDGAAEAKLIALTCGPAPEGFAKWSLRLLEEKVVELNIVEKASDNTIGRTLKKTFSNPISKNNG